jgi:carbamoyltransferase
MKITIAIHTRHDANLSVACDDKIVSYIEFEKIAKKRYFAFSEDSEIFKSQCKELLLPFVREFSVIDEAILNWVTEAQQKILHQLLPQVKVWKHVHHHIAHAWSSYVFTEPMQGDLILSYDGGGDMGDFFKVFQYKNSTIVELVDVPVNLGRPYRLLGLLSPELYRQQKEEYSLEHALAGKIMALVALGKITESYRMAMKRFYLDFEKHSVEENFQLFLRDIGFSDKKFLSLEVARDVLATSQVVFEEIVEEEFFPYVEKLKPQRIIVCGGCALNVTMNTKMAERFSVPIFISPCPNDAGISLGTLKMSNLNLAKLNRPFSNIYPQNKSVIDPADKSFSYEKFSVRRCAELLSSGKVLGTIRGPLEIGPRALGNRSYLANPFIFDMKNTINVMKEREFWRPVAPIILEEDLAHYFRTAQNSPYMSFAPHVRLDFKDKLKEILHFDDTARVQTVNSSDGWIYELLREFKKITGWGIIMNTSFNKKGEPLTNDIRDALEILRLTALDGIVTDDQFILK